MTITGTGTAGTTAAIGTDIKLTTRVSHGRRTARVRVSVSISRNRRSAWFLGLRSSGIRNRAFDKITKGLREALSTARGDAAPARLHIPLEINVRYIRNKLRLSQDDFAAAFGFTLNQITAWEQGRSRPLGGVRAYLMLIDREPGTVIGMLRSLRDVRKAA